MPAIAAGDLTKLRAEGHSAELFLSVCPATTLWSARVNDGSITRGETSITFDGGSGTSFTAVGEWQEVWIGSTAGAYDKGRARIRSISSGDSGVTGTLTVAANSIVWADDDYLTFVLWYLPKPRRPLLGGDGTFYKDSDIAYSDQNSQPPPVCIAGENRAGFLSGGSLVIASQLPSSYAVADGASISSYAASAVYPTSGLSISVNSGTGVGSITFTAAGFYWVKWSVTDSNGKTQDTFRWYAVHDSDPSSADYPHVDFALSSLTGDWNGGGWQGSIRLNDNADLDDVPDRAPVIVWQRAYYQGSEDYITFLPDESTTLINGYVRSDRFNQDLESGIDTADFQITTINGVASNKFNFSVSLEAQSSPAEWYQYASWLTPGRAVHHFLKWHSTLLEVCDVIDLMADTHGIAYAELENGTIFSMPDGFLRDRSIRRRLACDKGGRLHMVPDAQLLPDSDRGALTTVADIENTNNLDKSGEVQIIRRQENATPFVHVSGFSFAGTFDANGNPDATPICAVAPGDTPDDDGGSPINLGRQTLADQTEANAVAGRVFSGANNEFPELRINLHGNYAGVLEPALAEFWTMSMLATENLRGIVWTAKNLILRNVNVQFPGDGRVFCVATFEPEAPAFSGTTTDCPSYPAIDGDDPVVPDEAAGSGALLTASSVWRLPPYANEWLLDSSEDTNDLIIDPYWQSRTGSEASADGIVWRCGDGYVKRSTDSGQNWSAVTPGTSPPNDAGDASPPGAGDLDYVMLGANWTAQGEFVVLGRWQNASNAWRSWIAYTDDDGSTWTWQSLIGTGGTFTDTSKDFHEPSDGLTVDKSDLAVMTSSLVLVAGETGNVSSFDISGSYGVTHNTNIKDSTHTPLSDGDVGIVRLTDTQAFLAMTYDEGGERGLICRTVDTSPLAYNSVLTLHDIDGSGITDHENVFVVALTSTKVLVISQRAESSVETMQVDYITISGGTCTLTDTITYQENAPEAVFPLGLARRDDDTAVVLYVSDPGQDLYGATINISSGTVVISNNQEVLDGASYAVDITPPFSANTLIHISGDVYAFGMRAFDGTWKALVVAIDISTLSSWSVGTPVEFTGLSASGTGYPQFQGLVHTGGGEILVCGGDWLLEEGSVDGTTVTASGTTHTWGYNGEGADVGTIALIESGAVCATYPEDPPSGAPYKLMSLATATIGSSEIKGTGVAIGKVTGSDINVTGWQGDDTLRLYIYATSDLSQQSITDLGATTLAQLDAGTWLVYPYAPFGLSADELYLFGRMNAPAGLSGTRHIIKTENSASSFINIENGWGSDTAGALVSDGGGSVWAIRNVGSGAKLYDVTNGAVLSTIPFAAGVNPHALLLDAANAVIYACGDTSVSDLIYKSLYPFTAWVDITYQHGTSNPINAIVKL